MNAQQSNVQGGITYNDSCKGFVDISTEVGFGVLSGKKVDKAFDHGLADFWLGICFVRRFVMTFPMDQ